MLLGTSCAFGSFPACSWDERKRVGSGTGGFRRWATRSGILCYGKSWLGHAIIGDVPVGPRRTFFIEGRFTGFGTDSFIAIAIVRFLLCGIW
tara:strand:- start:78 stop:353 length:276 start_codon:yes stop_codon:yes gene_type:complete